MGNTVVLKSCRGTKLFRNREENLTIQVSGNNGQIITKILLIRGEHIGIRKIDSNKHTIQVSPNQEYFLVNLSNTELTLDFTQNPQMHELLFDPYQYEKNPFEIINPDVFQKTHSVPKGYIDILPKWYSIKFTYPNKNLIYIRPHLGVSIQSHTKRTEDWTVIEGRPIIIANSKMFYSVNPGDKFHTDSGNIHSIFNHMDSWAIIEEIYSGKFEEEDIVRIFNPNHYQEIHSNPA